MELTLNQNHLSCYDTTLDTTVFHEETMEMIVPDACPDILRIADTCAQVCLRGKEAQEGRVELSGTAKCAVLYLPDGADGMRRIEVNVPFLCGVDAPGVAAGCSVVAVPRVQNADTRVINPRKVLVRVNLAIRLQVYHCVENDLCTGAEDDAGVEQLCETHNAYMAVCVQEKTFTYSDDLAISGSRPEAEELLNSDVSLLCSESKIIGNKLIFKGSAVLKLLYRSVDGALASTSYELPFSQIMEVNSAEEADCMLEVLLNDFSCTLVPGDGRSVSVSMELLAQAVIWEERRIDILADIYSVSADLTAEVQNYSTYRLLEQSARRQSARDVVETPTPAKATLDARVCLGAVTQTWEGDRLTVTASAVVTVLYLSEEEEAYTVSREINIPCQIDLDGSCTCSCNCRTVGEVFATPTSGGIEVRFELDFQYMALLPQNITAVSGVQISDTPSAEGENHPSVVLRAVAHERLWDIAKSYRTTMADILLANELESEEGLQGKLLLIPRKR